VHKLFAGEIATGSTPAVSAAHRARVESSALTCGFAGIRIFATSPTISAPAISAPNTARRSQSASASPHKRTGGGVRAPQKRRIDAPPEIVDSTLNYVPLASTTLLYATTRSSNSGSNGGPVKPHRPQSALSSKAASAASNAAIVASASSESAFGRGSIPSYFASSGQGHLDFFLRQAQAQATPRPHPPPTMPQQLVAAGNGLESSRAPVPLVSFKQAMAAARPASVHVRLAMLR
jgi:hypothetical protein